MNLVSELSYRLSKALDFLSGLRTPDGKFIAFQDNNTTSDARLSLYLQAVSTLLTGAKIFDKQNLVHISNELMLPVDNATFMNNDEACIISDETSSTIGNALAVFVANKREQNELALLFARSLLSCIGKSEISFFYKAGTKEEELRKHRHEAACGFISLALLKAYSLSNDSSFMSSAEKVIGIAMKKGRFDHLDLWSMKLAEPNEEYQSRADHLINVLNSKTKETEQLPLSTTAMILLANLAWHEFSDSKQNELLLKHIFSLQNESGSFRISKDHEEMDTLSLVRAINAMLVYQHYLTGDSQFPPVL